MLKIAPLQVQIFSLALQMLTLQMHIFKPISLSAEILDDILDPTSPRHRIAAFQTAEDVDKVISNTIDSFVKQVEAASSLQSNSNSDANANANANGSRGELVHQLKNDIETLLLEAGVEGIDEDEVQRLVGSAIHRRSAANSNGGGTGRGLGGKTIFLFCFLLLFCLFVCLFVFFFFFFAKVCNFLVGWFGLVGFGRV